MPLANVAVPKLLFRIRIRPAVSFGSGFGFESRIQIRIRNKPKTFKNKISSTAIPKNELRTRIFGVGINFNKFQK
jgi:hypothetical protein